MGQLREGISGYGLEGQPSCIQSQLKCLLWQSVPVRGYPNAEGMCVSTGFTPLVVILESMTSKPIAEGGSQNCVTWKVEKAVGYFLLTGFNARLAKD